MRQARDVSVSTVDLDTLQRVAQAAHVTSAVLYGSHARGEATRRSDVDLAVAFDSALSSVERTRARLDLIARLGTELGTDAVDVVPLSGVSPSLVREIREDGIILYGSPADRLAEDDLMPPDESHQERLATFDEHLAALERIV